MGIMKVNVKIDGHTQYIYGQLSHKETKAFCANGRKPSWCGTQARLRFASDDDKWNVMGIVNLSITKPSNGKGSIGIYAVRYAKSHYDVMPLVKVGNAYHTPSGKELANPIPYGKHKLSVTIDGKPRALVGRLHLQEAKELCGNGRQPQGFGKKPSINVPDASCQNSILKAHDDKELEDAGIMILAVKINNSSAYVSLMRFNRAGTLSKVGKDYTKSLAANGSVAKKNAQTETAVEISPVSTQAQPSADTDVITIPELQRMRSDAEGKSSQSAQDDGAADLISIMDVRDAISWSVQYGLVTTLRNGIIANSYARTLPLNAYRCNLLINGMYCWMRLDMALAFLKRIGHDGIDAYGQRIHGGYVIRDTSQLRLTYQPSHDASDTSNLHDASIDHVVPQSVGGDTVLCNLQICETKTNQLKSSHSMPDVSGEPEISLRVLSELLTGMCMHRPHDAMFDMLMETIVHEMDACKDMMR